MQAWSAQPIDGTILGVRLPASWRMSVRAGEHERLRFGRFSSIAKSMAFWAFDTGAIASASIASFSIVRGGRDAKPAVAGIQSDAPRGSEAIAVPGSMADRPGAIADGMNPRMRVADSDALHPPKSSRLGEADAGVAKPLQQGAAGVRETVPAARRETETSQPSIPVSHIRSSNRSIRRQRQTTPRTIPPRRLRDPSLQLRRKHRRIWTRDSRARARSCKLQPRTSQKRPRVCRPRMCRPRPPHKPTPLKDIRRTLHADLLNQSGLSTGGLHEAFPDPV